MLSVEVWKQKPTLKQRDGISFSISLGCMNDSSPARVRVSS